MEPRPRVLCSRVASDESGTCAIQPLGTGVPMPRGALRPPDCNTLRLRADDGRVLTGQCEVRARWGDGSVKWLGVEWTDAPLLDSGWAVYVDGAARETTGVSPASTRAAEDKSSPCLGPSGHLSFPAGAPGFDVTDSTGKLLAGLRIAASVELAELATEPIPTVQCLARGPVKEVWSLGWMSAGTKPLDLQLEVHAYRALPLARLEVSVTNPHKAEHPRGTWPLGAGGEVEMDALTLTVRRETPAPSAYVALDADEMPETFESFDLLQASSGGAAWNSATHLDAEGKLSVPFRGYRGERDGTPVAGDRASPLVGWTGPGGAAVAVENFWQNFPKRLRASRTEIVFDLMPGTEAGKVHLQGGERKTHTIWLWLDPQRSPPLETLAWMHTLAVVVPDPRWCEHTGAIAYLTPRTPDPADRHARLVDNAIAGEYAFAQKRELADEFGWRNFGDVTADHELSYYRDPKPFVSHYNNQYDIIFGCALQLLRSADARWFDEMRYMARHVADIDIYHTDQDRDAYNHGLFWHTAHDVSADTSTHRTYPGSGIGGSGGPSCEHVYTRGLALHYYLTGATSSKSAVLELADFVMGCDDPDKTPFRWLSNNPTGLASQTGPPDYHGPGRGAGNALGVLVDAYLLTWDSRYIDTAQQLVRRCIHPNDDISARRLDDPEVRWSYMVYLRNLIVFLDAKRDIDSFDDSYDYARAALLHYADWAANNEYFYLDKASKLLEPTETWAAQELRKSEVFDLAATYAPAGDSERYRERAEFHLDRALSYLMESDTAHYARPVALALSFGHLRPFFRAAPEYIADDRPLPPRDWGQPTAFVPQRKSALLRLTLAVTCGLLFTAATTLAVWL